MSSAYSDHDPELEKQRLFLQAEVFEPLADRALAQLPSLEGARVLDVACGAMGILRTLSKRVGSKGHVVGADVSDVMVTHAREFCARSGITNVEVVRDDAYQSKLPERSFDLVHVRLLLTPIGRDLELAPQLERLVKPGGWIMLEEPDGFESWWCSPDDPAIRRLNSYIMRAYRQHMGGDNAGQRIMPLARSRGWKDIHFDAQVLAMPPGHPYLQLPILVANALRGPLLKDTPEAELDSAIAGVREACKDPNLYGMSFRMMQLWARAHT
jgi:SAM-dependent methyltransferase